MVDAPVELTILFVFTKVVQTIDVSLVVRADAARAVAQTDIFGVKTVELLVHPSS